MRAACVRICRSLLVQLLAVARTAAGCALRAKIQMPRPRRRTPEPAPIRARRSPRNHVPAFQDTRFWLSGQANFIFQTHPSFHAAYSGTNSLSPNYEKATSRVMTLYTGVRLNNSTELLVDIEEAGGAALSTGLGLAGNTDLDIVRNPLLSKAPYLGRGMIHKVFALSKDKVENQRSFLSLFDELPAPPPRNPLRQIQHAGFLRHQFRGLRYSPSIHQLDHRQQRRLGLRRRHPRLHRRR